MKVLSLFSGIGAFEKALDNLQIPYELAGFSEIDKYAVKSYCAIHSVPESMNLGDITKIDEKALPKDIDLITYGFPCQDISLAGKQKGLFNDDGTQTRSGLFFEALRVIETTQPRVAIAENVKNLTGKKFKEQFALVLESLDEAGYNNYWKVLNAKDYGIPQNRERVFIVSIRKDIDSGTFKFPEGFPLELRLKDMLEDEVDEKFYLDSTKEYFIKHSFESEEKGNGFRFAPHVKKNANVAKTVTTRAGGRMDDNFVVDVECEEDTFKFDSTNKMIQVGQMYGTEKEPNPQAGRIYDADGISPTMDTCSGGNRMPKVAVAMRGRYNDEGEVEQQLEISDREYANCITTIQKDSLVGEEQKILVKQATKKGYAEAVEGDSVNVERPNSKTRRGRVGKQVAQTLTTSPQQGVVEAIKEHNQNAIHQQDLVQCATGVCRTIPAGTHGSTPHLLKTVVGYSPLRIRKLTPKECFRLMGFDDEDFYKAEATNSNTQLYKQAGNSIVVDVLEAVFANLKPYLSERK